MLLQVVSLFATIVLILLVYIAYLKRKMSLEVRRKVEEKEREIRKDALERSRASLKGKLSEQIAPFLQEFDYSPPDARFLGSPVDYVIFDGYTDVKDGDSEELDVVFCDIKKGEEASLTPTQRKIKDAVENKRVDWETINLED